MPKLIKDGAIIDNTWQLIEATDTPEQEVPAGQVIVPLNVWQAQKDALSARTDVGVWLASTETADLIKDDAPSLPLIALDFPVFMDGRAFTAAYLLRQRFGYTGELRAIGNPIRDQLCYLRRCGVNAFDLNEDIDLDGALKSLNDFSEAYQHSVDLPEPLFRRRA